MNQLQKQQMIEILDKRLQDADFAKRRIFLFGHCNAAEHTIDYLVSHGILPLAILDNSLPKQGGNYKGIPILSPNIITRHRNTDCTIIIASRFYNDMCRQLRELEYNDEIIRVVNFILPGTTSQPGTTPVTAPAGISGTKTLADIRNKYPDQRLIICPYNALGDVYWAMAYLPAYLKNNNLTDSETITAVIKGGCCEVAKMFTNKNITPLSSDAMNELVSALIQGSDDNYLIAHHDLPDINKLINYLNKGFLTFQDYYKQVVYNLPIDTSPSAPQITSSYTHPIMPKGKSVIISPYAKSVTEPPIEYWEQTVEEYIKQGLSVYTNILQDEQPISGTTALEVPAAQLISAVEYAGEFIGIRNGICDILYTAKCKKTVVFPDCFYSVTKHKVKDFFALPGWDAVTYN